MNGKQAPIDIRIGELTVHAPASGGAPLRDAIRQELVRTLSEKGIDPAAIDEQLDAALQGVLPHE